MKDVIENVIHQTTLKYGKNQSKYIIYKFLTKRNLKEFANLNGGYRNLIAKMNVEDLENELTGEYLRLILDSKIETQNPLEKAINTTYVKYKDDLIGVRCILQTCLKETLYGNNMFPVNIIDKNLLISRANEMKLTVGQYVASRISDKVVENIGIQKDTTISKIQTYPNM